jgi:uncharacterized membrane protein
VTTNTPSKPNLAEKQTTGSPKSKDIGLERLVFFSDAVFAISITLLTLEIRLPEEAAYFNNDELLASLLGNWHQYLAFLISFLVVGSFWTSHHRKFRYIMRYDRSLINLNLLLLMAIAFIPFPTSIISVNSNLVATIFYASGMMVPALMFIFIWWYASRRYNLIVSDLDERIIRREFAAPIATGLIFLISIGIAFVNPGWARITWILIFPISLIIHKKYDKQE